MKPTLLALLFLASFGCATEKQIQAEMVDATLVKVEVINRYPNIKEKLFTWETSRNITFVTIEPQTANMPVGTSTKVLMPK